MSTVTIACVCPRKNGPQGEVIRHPEGDTITLRDHLDFKAGMTARNAVQLARVDDPDMDAAEILTILTEIYVLHGIEAWTIVDDKGKPVPVTRPAIRSLILSSQERALTVGDAADAIYAEAVMLPLLEMGQRSSQDSPTESSTSLTTNGSADPTPIRRSKRSSTTTSPTDAIAKMSASPGGAFS